VLHTASQIKILQIIICRQKELKYSQIKKAQNAQKIRTLRGAQAPTDADLYMSIGNKYRQNGFISVPKYDVFLQHVAKTTIC
jgi:hypothetical protein